MCKAITLITVASAIHYLAEHFSTALYVTV